MRKAFKIIALILLGSSAFCDQVVVSNFKGGLNNNNNAVTIDQSQAQDLLNVDVSVGGLSVKKRPGYGTYKTLSTAQALHGGIHFYNSSGNDVQIWGSSTSLYGITSDATPAQLISSATLNTTWDCVDTQASAYCVNSSRNAYVKTDGATMTWYATPLGTMVEATPDRVVVSGLSGTPSTLYVSQANTFTNFTTGVNATDAFTEVIAAPGSKITNIRWACGKLLWWKDASFGYLDFDDQYTAQVKTVSDIIGTLDNTSAVDPGGQVWFRGQDGHTWKYDCSILTKESLDISPNISASGRRTSNSWTQTTIADWQTGTISPTSNLSIAVPSDVVTNNAQQIDDTDAEFQAGTQSSTTASGSTVFMVKNSSRDVNDPSFEGSPAGSWTSNGSWLTFVGSTSKDCGTILPQNGSNFDGGCVASPSFVAYIRDAVSNNILDQVSIPTTGDCTWTSRIFSTGSYLGRRVKVQFSLSGNSSTDLLTSTASYIIGGDIKFYTNYATSGANKCLFVDYVGEGQTAFSTIPTGYFTSSTFDTGFTSSTIQLQMTTTPSDDIGNTSFSVQTATASPGAWTTLSTSSGTNGVGNRYVRYVSSFTDAGVRLTNATVISRSTGTFYSAVHNVPNFSTWSTLGTNGANNGGGQTFYVRGGGTIFSVTSTTPAWTSIMSGAVITSSTGTYIQFRDDFSLSQATNTPLLSDFTLSWFEGTAADQAYMIYFDNAIWESVAFGVGQATNNYIFKRDLINDGWTVYNFGAGGMLVQNNTLYFGDTSTGAAIFNYGTGNSDNGSVINSYWRSKAFSGADPYLENTLTNIDSFLKTNQGSSVIATYTVNGSTNSTSYTISLSTSTDNVIRSKKLLPLASNAGVFDLKFSDNSTSTPWELFGYRVGFTPLPYRPSK